MGRVIAPFGVKGWVKLDSFSASPENLLAYPVWWIGKDGAWREQRIESAKAQGRAVVAKFAGCEDRDHAAELRGFEVGVPRDTLPKPEENEFYWADLIGLAVVNMQDEKLGTVSRVFETGANDVLVVEGERERLIPFIDHVVREVNIASGVIRVDWGADY